MNPTSSNKIPSQVQKTISTQTYRHHVPKKPHLIYDASGVVLGRLASVVAKKLLEGHTVEIINAEKAVISGKHRLIINEYQRKTKIKTKSNPRRGPFYPKRADRIVKRTIRGMLPWKKTRGREAYKRLLVHLGTPKHIDTEKVQTPPNVRTDEDFRYRLITIGDISRRLRK